MGNEDNPRVTVSRLGGRTVRTTVWNPGTWNERTQGELEQHCPLCSSTWWTEEDPRKPIEVVCSACNSRQSEQVHRAKEAEARKLRGRRLVVLIPVGFCIVTGLIANIVKLITWLVNRN